MTDIEVGGSTKTKPTISINNNNTAQQPLIHHDHAHQVLKHTFEELVIVGLCSLAEVENEDQSTKEKIKRTGTVLPNR